jgi:hypothetical protein
MKMLSLLAATGLLVACGDGSSTSDDQPNGVMGTGLLPQWSCLRVPDLR